MPNLNRFAAPAVYASAAFTMLAALAWVAVSVLDFGEWSRNAKMSAACGFIATALLAGAAKHRYGRIILVGLIFSWFGDLFLSYSGTFLQGLVSFLLGHVAYSIAFATQTIRPKQSAIAAAAMALPAAAIVAWLYPNLDEMRIPVLAYTAVISVMFILSAGLVGRPGGNLACIGALAFWMSDLFVARGAFVIQDDYNRYIGSPLYFGGQVLIALSIAYVAVPESEVGPADE